MSAYLIYDGYLSERAVHGVVHSGKEYEHWIELSSWPDGFYEWSKENLPKYPIAGEDCMGGETLRHGTLSSWVDQRFLGLKTADEKQRVIKAFPEYVVNADPFRVALKDVDISHKIL